MIITIDGPSASGKSSVSRVLANRLGFYYVCSGLIYRAIAYFLVNRHGYTLETLACVRSEHIKECIYDAKLRYEYNAIEKERIFFKDNDITSYLKDKFIDQATSIVSVNEEARHVVTFIQRDIAQHYSIVIDGRDVGSVVFPDAEVKFFITASVNVRAERWRKDQQQKYNNNFLLDEAVKLVMERDQRDTHRLIAPLVVPQNAIVIDTSLLNIEQTVEKMMKYINDYLPSVL